MDPNTVLAEIRSLIESIDHAKSDAEVHRALADASVSFTALDEWLSSGGFLPTAWQRTTSTDERSANDIVNGYLGRLYQD